MDDVPWLYVAMIFIAFASWVWQRFQEAAAIRREKVAERKSKERARNTTQAPEWDSPYQNQTSPTQERPPSGEPVEGEQPKSFREIFAEIERQVSEPEIPVEEPPTPPPLPASASRDSESSIETSPPSFSLEPETFSPEPEAKTSSRPASASLRKKKKKRRNRETSDALTGVLRNRGSLRTALILKEVLDKPRALRR